MKRSSLFLLLVLVGSVLALLLNLWCAGERCSPSPNCESEVNSVCESVCRSYGFECLLVKYYSSWCCDSTRCCSEYKFWCTNTNIRRGYICESYTSSCRPV
jgi:hypothetical protein